MRRTLSSLLLLLAAATSFAETKTVTLSVDSAPADRGHLVVRVPLDESFAAYKSVTLTHDGAAIPGQIASVEGKPTLVARLNAVKADQAATCVALFDTKAPVAGFQWTDADGAAPELTYAGHSVLKYVRPTFDPAQTPAKKQPIANPTIKVYHHLFDRTGGVQLTNGAEGQFPHHRGIYFGFNNISYDGKKADVWHCRNGESQQHQGVVQSDAGPAFGGHKVRIHWNGQDGKPFAVEERTLSVFPVEKGWLIQFDSHLTTDRAKVRLDGDPQHAGFHFRAAQEVEAKNKAQTYFLRPDGKGEMGKEVNWAPKSKNGPVNLPWNAMSFVVGDKRYTCLYIDHPENPKEARQSERTYGRFGNYFEYDLSKDKPLTVKYRLLVIEGELTSEACVAASTAFAGKVAARLK
jgi:Methane oxygenase PmoA